MLHDSIRRRTARLEVVGDSITKELEKTRQELERIRRAIRG
jgi:predicted  nucleic acid-binding Zn-ribbon protein